MQESEAAIAEFRQHAATLSAHDYDLKKTIGSGGFATVYLVTSRLYQTEFAAKVTKYKGTMSGADEAEIRSLMQLDHPNIINLYNYFVDDQYLYMILDYCPGGSLKNLISTKGALPPDAVYAYCKQVAEALAVCHARGLAHRDIKPENVLVDVHGRLKLADFGLGMICSRRDQSTTEVDGSVCYSPPEFFRAVQHNPFKSDIWSLGLVFYFIAKGNIPWRGVTLRDIVKEISDGYIDLEVEILGPDLVKLLSQMLSKDPHDRPDIERILVSPFMQHALPLAHTQTRSLSRFLNPIMKPKKKRRVSDMEPGEAHLTKYASMFSSKNLVCMKRQVPRMLKSSVFTFGSD